MGAKEAKARIKINRLLEEAGWRFFDDENGPANICRANYHAITPLLDPYENKLFVAAMNSIN